MIELLAILAPIALIDSLSVVPIASVPLVMLLGGRRPVAGSLAFLAGIFFTYFPFGVLLLFGLDAVFDRLANHFVAWWSREPDIGEVILQIIIGLLMVVYGGKLWNRRGKIQQETEQSAITPAQAFSMAALINITGMWGALPYFAAVAQILKADFSASGMLIALLFYNLVFALPLSAFLFLRLLIGERSQRWFESINVFLARWGGRILLIVLIGLGLLLIADGTGWLFGWPLIMPGFEG
ncbi:MAG TPA: hypothetical protein ENK44_08845 [Caldithrix abyssi]|uniref:GAP family protein n=1 Tax=Caldithrix abyssi TaxID=187145 RepID=A0A7V4U0K5_CALAY|nr:hypothetical protein [Caldithrix abyssi]